VSSGSAHPIDFDDVMLGKPGAHRHGYGQSKLAQATMTVALAPRFARDGITMVALHPATMMDTTMVRGLGVAPLASVDEGRDHVMGLIRAPSLQPGRFYIQGLLAKTRDPQPKNPEARRKLVSLSEKLTGVALAP
jgi:NAD(P)-dependent dehydrogenase (short-subunit alcohol dehydrogenase family)